MEEGNKKGGRYPGIEEKRAGYLIDRYLLSIDRAIFIIVGVALLLLPPPLSFNPDSLIASFREQNVKANQNCLKIHLTGGLHHENIKIYKSINHRAATEAFRADQTDHRRTGDQFSGMGQECRCSGTGKISDADQRD